MEAESWRYSRSHAIEPLVTQFLSALENSRVAVNQSVTLMGQTHMFPTIEVLFSLHQINRSCAWQSIRPIF